MLAMKNLGRISQNLILMLLIRKVSRVQSYVFLINMPLRKYVCANEASFMTKELHKPI